VNAASESIWTALPLGRAVELLKFDQNGLGALAKPAGVLSHPNVDADRPRSLITAHYDAAAECYVWSPDGANQPCRLWLLNRLDSGTSGVILVSRDGELATEIRAQFKRKQVAKIYQALVFGKPPRPVEIWRDSVTVEKKGGRIRTATDAGRIPAECKMTVVRSRGVGEGALALIQLEPRTGRSHQLRVQCAKRHLPIVGDQTYGDFGHNRAFAKRSGEKRMFLHSLATHFDYEWKGKTFSFAAKAELPGEFSVLA
jgi:23S rRNA-/tRNA-specific pseudouridylate synthase